MIEKFIALAANSFMKIYYRKLKRKEPNRASETALMDWSQQHELLGLHRENGGLRRFQQLPTGAVPVGLLDGLDALHEPETGVVGFEVCVGQHVLGGDEKIFQRNLVVAKMNRVAHRTEPERLDFQSGRLRSHFEDQRHSFSSLRYWTMATLSPQRLSRISIILKPVILDHKSQEAASTASWECLKNFSFLLLQKMVRADVFLRVLLRFWPRKARQQFQVFLWRHTLATLRVALQYLRLVCHLPL